MSEGRTFSRLAVAVPVLLAFLASLMLQSLARPDETPRSEIERLIGVDIASPSMASMSMAGNMADCDEADMVMPAQPKSHKPGHHHDAACALCPLLQLGFFILAVALLVAFARSLKLSQRVFLPPSRAPPELRWVLPPAQAPPLT
ncbi:DUF2946 domain-containing protein [Asaia sp. HN010]|uniref:DUF2946 domain-containing protein n=1 Tax=Asaia sp. HN010 TaxID=3081233 RepID=UPI0030167D20